MNIAMELFPKAVIFEGLMRDFPKKVREIAFSEIDRIANKTNKRIRSLTPGKKLPKGWKVVRRGNAFMRERRITNTDPRAYKPVATKRGVITNLIEMMEFGTQPHLIVPVKAKVLRFVSREGDLVFTKRVEHPGTEPYSMIGISFVEAAEDIGKLQLRLASELRSL